MSLCIYNEDCIKGSEKIPDGSVHLGIYDPPFGIEETKFDKHYNRDDSNVISGYQEAPKEYDEWTYAWMKEAKRILHDNGSMYIFMGHSNLRAVLNAANALQLHEINHIIWKYNFGVYTRRKYVTSHYHVLFYSKSEKSKITFNTNCRFGNQEKDDKGSLLYRDLEDVFIVNKEYAPGEIKNQNKLPTELIRKLVLYSSNQDDVVCDFFMGNFTTAYVAYGLGRKVVGFEINDNSYNYHIPQLQGRFGCDLGKLKKVENIVPQNQGKKVSKEELESIFQDYQSCLSNNLSKGKISKFLQEKYQRGKFSIQNILKKLTFPNSE